MAEAPATTFRCRCCGTEHPGPPLNWRMEAPEAWTALTSPHRRKSIVVVHHDFRNFNDASYSDAVSLRNGERVIRRFQFDEGTETDGAGVKRSS